MLYSTIKNDDWILLVIGIIFILIYIVFLREKNKQKKEKTPITDRMANINPKGPSEPKLTTIHQSIEIPPFAESPRYRRLQRSYLESIGIRYVHHKEIEGEN